MPCTVQSKVNYGVRRLYDEGVYEFPVDPEWGIPEPNCWVWYDSATGYVRPFSSTNVVADVAGSAVKGVVKDFVRPGRPRTVYVYTKGVADIQVAPAAAVTGGVTKFAPYLDGAAVSNYKFTVSGNSALQIMTAIAHGSCPCDADYPDYCETAGAVAEDSPTAALVQAVVSKATVKFG